MVKCAICGKEFETDRKLHSHLKAHKMRMVEYYQSQFPRYDKYDGKIIKFKKRHVSRQSSSETLIYTLKAAT